MKIFPKKGIILAFGELFLKSRGVRDFFKKKLIDSLKFFLKKEKIDFKLYLFRERIFIETANFKKAIKIIKRIFGVSWFAETLFFGKINLRDFSFFISQNYEKWVKRKETFAIRLKRGEDRGENRKKIIEEIAKKINRRVNLENPQKEIFIEKRKEGWYLYFKKRKGAGGLPLGSAGKVLTLISGGIDSPVSAYLMAKRGAENVWLHFHSFPIVSKSSIEKVQELARIFLCYQTKLKVYLLPFSKIQMEIRKKISSSYRILLYRRMMFKIAEEILKKENCQALVTGESLGQVSSQTLSNLSIIEKAIDVPVLRPLIGMDKEEIINLAKKIGTYQISIKPQEDCCTLFTPKHSTAKGNLKKIVKMEKKFNFKKIIKKTIKEMEILNY